MIASCYFTTVPDPQRKLMTVNNSISYIDKWYKSLKDEAVVFHDDLSEEFISWFPGIEFIKVPHPDIDLYKYRWVVYLDYLWKHKEIKEIFFTDISDVIMLKKPEIKDDGLYCGDEEKDLFGWFSQTSVRPLKELPRYNELSRIRGKLLNAGIAGGCWQVMYDFLYIMNETINKIRYADKEILGDMFIFNYVAYLYFKDIVHGWPVNSRYGFHEEIANVWFIHK